MSTTQEIVNSTFTLHTEFRQSSSAVQGIAVPVRNNSATISLETDVKHSVPDLPRANTAFESFVAILTMGLLFGYAWLLPVLLPLAIFAAVFQANQVATAFLAVLLLDCLLPAGHYQPWVREHWVWDTWRRYFRMRVVIAEQYDQRLEGKRHIYAHYPHGTFPMASWLAISLCGAENTTFSPDLRGVVASVLLQLPLVKHVYGGKGCIAADRATVARTLKNHDVGLLPEGVAGIFRGATRTNERVFVSSHKGFCKLALQNGADIVPVYNLGQSQVMSFYGLPGLSRRLRLSFGTFAGRWGMPLPRRTDLIVLHGHIIKVDAAAPNPSQASVDALHAKVVAELTRLYYAHRHLLPEFKEKDLELV